MYKQKHVIAFNKFMYFINHSETVWESDTNKVASMSIDWSESEEFQQQYLELIGGSVCRNGDYKTRIIEIENIEVTQSHCLSVRMFENLWLSVQIH